MQPAFGSLFVVFGLGCALCLVLTPICRSMAIRWGLVDRPDGRRKIHGQAIPLCGGIAILLAVSSLIAGAFLVPGPLADVCETQAMPLLGLFFAAIIICGVGIADDFE